MRDTYFYLDKNSYIDNGKRLSLEEA